MKKGKGGGEIGIRKKNDVSMWSRLVAGEGDGASQQDIPAKQHASFLLSTSLKMEWSEELCCLAEC